MHLVLNYKNLGYHLTFKTTNSHKPLRYDMAIRSLEYNLGIYPNQQTRADILNLDLRSITKIIEATRLVNEFSSDDISLCGKQFHQGRRYFDLITGTPPYFDSAKYKAVPTNFESQSCLFEMKGSIFQYCETASHLLRPMQHDTTMPPSLFTVCHSALCSKSVYQACSDTKMTVVKRIDVIPRSDKPVLFCVFVIVLKEWTEIPLFQHYFSISDHIDVIDPLKPVHTFIPSCEQYQRPETSSLNGRVEGSVMGEVVETLTVRDVKGHHTHEYADLLARLSKPSSFDREIYPI
jgi:tRNA1(Val) A37 N6-methylase TrmN6